MKTKKYYWIKYVVKYSYSQSLQSKQTVLNIHPFEWLNEKNTNIIERRIIDWKEISKEEYELGKDVVK